MALLRKVETESTKKLLQKMQQYEGQLSNLYKKRNQVQYLIDEIIEQRLYVLRELEKRGIRNGKIKVYDNRLNKKGKNAVL